MTMINLASLGITEEALVEKIVNTTVERLLETVGYDVEGDAITEGTALTRRMDKAVTDLNGLVQKMLDAKVEELGNLHVKPLIESRLESLVLQRTNSWGEKVGKPVTFIEYLIQRADAYMTAEVDHNGKAQGEGDSYGWRKHSTRVAYLMDKHLQYAIERAMKDALANANSSITKGIADAVKIALAEVQAKLKVEVKV